MRATAVIGLVGAAAFLGLGACDSWYSKSEGPPVPRLSASLSSVHETTSAVYTARILVATPRNEYLSLAASDGATLSFAGSTTSTVYCAIASSEQVFEVTSTDRTPHLTVVLGKWTGDGGPPTLGPESACATSGQFSGEEAMVVRIPAAPAPTTTDGGFEPDAAMPDDGAAADSESADAVEAGGSP
jgi:hypothetical protein